jgi:hypothetical protein
MSSDPTKVVRAALQGAASVAGLLITTEAMVAELPKKQSLAMPGGPWGRHGWHGLLTDRERRRPWAPLGLFGKPDTC